ncbi:hypothetical protein EYR41_004245 [Orbilia oligospora]|uniref:Uncharacterized protein n=1 Tax=Orbilia oligospora TaxID=2813651 RepID=A0A8H2HTY1_ORBOL|nr:hypothetical protein EYR41_004245 [Orbilia oligospora]
MLKVCQKLGGDVDKQQGVVVRRPTARWHSCASIFVELKASEAAACVPVNNGTLPEYLIIFNRHVAHEAPSSTRVEEKLSQIAYFKAKSIIGCPSGTLVILKAPGISFRTPLV